ncbi:MAG: cupin domain-containing protein [Pseudomonadota bacterium]|nr:cupin domain-containing protein [Pseudomonadota bacterium]
MPEMHREAELKNIFSNLPDPGADEWLETLLQTEGFHLERIISYGHISPDNFWYDQDHPEWVILLSGGARLVFADQNEEIELRPGDYLNIPAHRKHRVVWTNPDQPSIWLTIHYET